MPTSSLSGGVRGGNWRASLRPPAQRPASSPTIRPSGGNLTRPGGGAPVAYQQQYTPPPMQNTARPSQGISQAQRDYEARLKELRGREGQQDPFLLEQINNLRERMSQDQVDRSVGRAVSGIQDAAAAQSDMMLEANNAAGRSGGVGERDLAQISDTANMNAARARSDIELGQQSRLDNLVLGGQGIMGAPSALNLAREGNVNQMTLAGLNYAMAPEELALAQQGLGLQQWQAQDASKRWGAEFGLQQQLANQQMQNNGFAQWENMLRLAGY